MSGKALLPRVLYAITAVPMPVSETEPMTNPSEHQREGTKLLVCGGFAKCGTTSLAAALDRLPGVRVHPDKEPRTLKEPDTDLHAYLRSFRSNTRDTVLADFTTSYMATRNRDAFASNLEGLRSILPVQAIFSVRAPLDRLKSEITHHGRYQLGAPPWSQSELMRFAERVLRDVDVPNAIDALCRQLGAHNVFIVRFEDITEPAGQQSIIDLLSDFLHIPRPETVQFHRQNDAQSVYRYGGGSAATAQIAKRAGLHRFIAMSARARIRSAIGRPVASAPLPASVVDRLAGELSRDELAFHDNLVTGVAQRPVLDCGSSAER